MSSRHERPAKVAGYTVGFGWDNPMNTYFCQVQTDEEETVLWLGDVQKGVSDPAAMVAPLSPWYDLTENELQQLRQDRAADLDRRPSPLQQLAQNLGAINARTRRDWLRE